jgi:hypothetical protein
LAWLLKSGPAGPAYTTVRLVASTTEAIRLNANRLESRFTLRVPPEIWIVAEPRAGDRQLRFPAFLTQQESSPI